jgi:ribonuclease HII
MPWIIGIDEAGYGPNLGPLVMTSVACRVPDKLRGADLWKVLAKAVRRQSSEDDGRLLIGDSKVVYSPARGLARLETSVLATLTKESGEVRVLDPLVRWLSPDTHPELVSETWYAGNSELPASANAATILKTAACFHACCLHNGIVWGLARSVIVCPKRFNQLLSHWGSKGAVLAEGLMQLLQWNQHSAADSESLLIIVDKHGGRNNYAAMLQHAFVDGVVLAQQESLSRSIYQVLGLNREVRVTIQPRADAEHFCVALASMVSKYLRELLMLEFNRFWQLEVPGLKATAGYPSDAARFFDDIRPAAKRLGIAEIAIWRRR